MIDLKMGNFERSFSTFKEVHAETSIKASDNAKYLNIFAEIFILKMSEDAADISKLYAQSEVLSCAPALRRWFPLKG
jgi:hypothetical protein